MYCNKENVNILTSQLAAYGVRHAVVCPGSRNAPVSHNLNEHPAIECHPVTDERSAGFYAIGLCLATKSPVVVCVTSGSALLNVAPSVVEAFYLHLPIIVVSADRPPQWIGQQDGQTMQQPLAVSRYVRHSVSLPEPINDEERWYCRRLVDECMIESQKGCGGPVHINVPISEPLFDFSIAELPMPKPVSLLGGSVCDSNLRQLADQLSAAERPMLVVGQTEDGDFSMEDIEIISKQMVIVQEPLSALYNNRCPIDLAVWGVRDIEDYQPDFILYVGDAIVSKHLKRFLRKDCKRNEWIVNADGTLYDTFTHLSGIVQAHPRQVLNKIASIIALAPTSWKKKDFCELWQKTVAKSVAHVVNYQPHYSNMLAVKMFEEALDCHNSDFSVHYANSMSVRLGSLFSRHHVYCNRGVNGIEGSLSVACGFSLAQSQRTFCVIGDLSFFYDSNALWQSQLKGNLRILMLNNGGGAIFNGLKGLERSSAREEYIAANHRVDAQGICLQNNVNYLTATNEEELKKNITVLVESECERPMLLEVFTNKENDNEAYRTLYKSFFC